MNRPWWGVRLLMALVRLYQVLISPIIHLGGPQCRFHPTCSAYAMESLRKYGVLKGTWRSLGRLLRCHPLNPGGVDPP